jgi:small redox-active disulfide protein 2
VKLEILGASCPNCTRLAAVVARAVHDMAIDDAQVVKVTDYPTIIGYGVMSTPALAIDGKVVLVGRVPSSADVMTLIANALS